MDLQNLQSILQAAAATKAVTIKLSHDRNYELRYRELPPSRETSSSSDKSTISAHATNLITGIRYQIHLIAPASPNRTRFAPTLPDRMLINWIAWCFLAEVLKTRNRTSILATDPFEALRCADPGFPDPEPEILIEPDSQPFSVDPTQWPPKAVLFNNLQLSQNFSQSAIASLFSHIDLLPFHLSRHQQLMQHYDWYQALPTLNSIRTSKLPAETACLPKIRIPLVFKPNTTRSNKTRTLTIAVPWWLSSPDTLLVTPGNAPSLDTLSEILRRVRERNTHVDQHDSFYYRAPAARLLTAAGIPPDKSSFDNILEEIINKGQAQLPEGFELTATIQPRNNPPAD